MSSIVIKGNTSGQIELAAPDVAGSTTLTLPTGAGTVITTDNIDSNPPASLSTATGSAPSYSARAWVQFFGTGTVAIQGSGNVSSVTDNGAGTYTINFSTAMPDTNYSWSVGSNISLGSYTGYPVLASTGDVPALFTTSAFRIHTVESSTGGVRDVKYVCLSFFR